MNASLYIIIWGAFIALGELLKKLAFKIAKTLEDSAEIRSKLFPIFNQEITNNRSQSDSLTRYKGLIFVLNSTSNNYSDPQKNVPKKG